MGTRVREPAAAVDTPEIDTVGLDDGSRRQRVALAGAGSGSPTVFVKTTEPLNSDAGMVVRQAGATRTSVLVSGAEVSSTNELPVKARLLSETGTPYGPSNRVPVDIGTATIQASFESVVSTGNTTTTPLAANQVFTGAWEPVTDYASISLAIATDAGTPMDGARAQFSTTGVADDVIAEQVTTFGSSGGQAFFTIAPEASFFRIKYTNGAVAQTVLKAEITYHFNAVGVTQTPLGAPSDDRSMSQVGKAMLHGRHSSGFWSAIKSTIDGILSVAVENVVTIKKQNATVTGTLVAAAQVGSPQVYAGAGQTALMLTVPDGHASSQVYLSGTFSAGSQVFFEGSSDGTDASWFALNHRRNGDATTNDEATLLDAAPFGGPSPVGAGVSNWRGSPGGVRFLRVRLGTMVAGDSVNVRITTSEGGGPVFQQGPPPMQSDNFAAGTLTGPNQTVTIRSNGGAGWAAFMNGQFSGSVFFEASIDGVNFDPINGAVQGVGTLQRAIVGTGQVNQRLVVRGGAGGLSRVRLRSGNDFVGNFTGEIRVGAGTGGVFLTAPVPIAGLGAGAQTTRNSVGTAASRIDPSPLAVRTTVEVLYQANGAANNGVVYVGFTNGVTAGNGRALSPGESWTLDLLSSIQIFAVASAAGQQVQVTELG